MKNPDKRTSILRAAERLFAQQGFHGTGVDQIASESGVTKRTLYKHFGSKDGLIRAVLEDHLQKGMERLHSELSSTSGDAREKLLACFEYYRRWFAGPKFSGCIFIKTLNEFAGCSTELGGLARDAKAQVRSLLREIAEEASIPEPDLLAGELQLLLEGSIVLAQCGRATDAIDAAEAMATERIDKALAGT